MTPLFSEINNHVRRIADTLAEVFVRADAEGLPTSVVADRIAEAKFKK